MHFYLKLHLVMYTVEQIKQASTHTPQTEIPAYVHPNNSETHHSIVDALMLVIGT